MVWHGHWDGVVAIGFWWIWPLGLALFWGAALVFGVWAVRSTGRRSASDGALDILKRRLAAGEISGEDYDRNRRAIQG